MYIDSQMNCYPCSFGIWDKSISESMNSKTLVKWQGDKLSSGNKEKKNVLVADKWNFVEVVVDLGLI